MRNRKILLAGLMTVAMGISMAGCGGNGNSEEKRDTGEQVTETEGTVDDTTEAASEDTVDDTTEAASEDTGSTEFAVPEYTDFTLEPGLSEKYADLDNRSFVYNGVKFTLGESTLKDLIDGGIPFDENDLNNSGNNVNKNYETERYSATINDYVYMQFMFANFTDSEQKAEDCVLSYVRYSHLYVPQPDYEASMNEEITEMMLDGAQKVHFSFPTTITRDQLLAHDSEGAEEDGKVVRYSADAEKYMGDSGYNFEFNEVTGQLKEVRISWLP